CYIDMPPGTGDIQLTSCQVVPLTAAVIVTTLQKLAFIDVAKGVLTTPQKLAFIDVENIDVENMCHFDADGKWFYLFGRGSGSQVVEQFGIPHLFDLPIRPTSHGSEPWEKPIHKHDQVVHTRRYLQRETPKRLFPWNSRKKSLSPESKEMLVKKMKEVEAFNASKMSAKTRDHGKKITSTQKEKRARCYICKERGHVFWKCQNKKKDAKIEKQNKSVKPTNKKVAEKIKYPEKVHVIIDYMIEGTDDANATWNEAWYVSMEAREGNFVIPNVHYTSEVTLNVLSFDLLEEQRYTVKISNNKCNLHYMFDGARTGKAQEENFTEDDGLKDVVTEHNKFLDKYFESIDPKEDCSLVKGLEDLKWDRNDVHDYVDEEYISWNGSLYAIKVNSFSRFLSFLNLIKKDSIVYKHWDVFSKRYLDMVKWFYLVYLNEDVLEQIPPIIGVVKIDLLGLHKMVDSLGGYLSVTLGNKWKKVAELHGLTEDDEEAIKKCYKKFIEMVQVYYETAEKPWHEKKPVENVVDSSIGYARVKDPQGCEKASAGMGEALEGTMNSEGKITHFGVKLEGNMDNNAGEGEMSTAVMYEKSIKAIRVKVLDSNDEFLLNPATDEWTGEQKLLYGDIREDIEPEEIRPMGNYAVSITWPDGFSQVRSLNSSVLDAGQKYVR
ncbi:ARID DNA-binding domain-containing protein, partial [Tanacetum coccineum]